MLEHEKARVNQLVEENGELFLQLNHPLYGQTWYQLVSCADPRLGEVELGELLHELRLKAKEFIRLKTSSSGLALKPLVEKIVAAGYKVVMDKRSGTIYLSKKVNVAIDCLECKQPVADGEPHLPECSNFEKVEDLRG